MLSNKKGKLFILSAPAGTGKTTLIEKITKEFPHIKQSISFTTRKSRGEEIDGVHYFFISKDEFEKKIQENEFLEYIELYGNYYGTSKKWVEEELEKGHHVVLVIDTQGALSLRNKVRSTYIFVSPPSLETLKERLVQRQTETLEVIEKRLSCAEREIEQGKEYDYKIINDKLDDAYLALKSIFIAEEHRITH